MALFECLMRKKTKESIVSSSPKLKVKEKMQEEAKNGQWAGVAEFRERRCTFSLGFWPIGPSVLKRSKKESCSTRRGLRVDTNLVEFRQLQKVGIFSYLR